MADLLTPADLVPFATIEFAKAQAMIDDALASAGLAAPCLEDPDLDEKKAKAAKAVLRAAVLRWNEAGAGGRTQVADTVGPFQHAESFDNTKPRRSLFWPSEIAQLQKICATAGGRGAWGYDTAGGSALRHAETCAINLGATFCDCGAYLTGSEPLWGNDGE